MPTLRLELAVRHDAESQPEDLKQDVAKLLGLDAQEVEAVRIVRRGIDARRRVGEPLYRLTVDAELTREPRTRAGDVRPVPEPTPRLESPRVEGKSAIVVGAGPAGLFAAWHLAERGARVTLIERGKPVETRARDFGQFRGRGILDPESNLCFGEGGAGTYSDGKLYTRTKSPLVPEVMERLVEVGAPPRILIDAKPHIGTNLLFRMLKTLRARLLSLGVEIRFQTRVERLLLDGPRVRGVATSAGDILADRTVLAMGHSARDFFAALLAQGVPMEPKPFAVGVRIEHPQSLIDASQYHRPPPRPLTLPAADYRLAVEVAGRGVYSFCMCPGGMIVPTATEPDTVVVNGMSTASRGSPFANSGLVAQVSLEDLAREGYGEHPLAGVEFQRALERAAFIHGGKNYHAPATRADELLRGKISGALADTHFRPGLTPSDLREVLPSFVIRAIIDGLRTFDRQIKGYGSSVANLIAVESRTSSPIRIPRDDDTLAVVGMESLYVAGEGPGYAGGIASAAVDGLRVAHEMLKTWI
ncbi:MAG: FAD-dependent oxidoreductase [Myxococcota bacterium]